MSADAHDLEGDTGRVTVRVLDAENWAEWTDEHTRQRAATDALWPAPVLDEEPRRAEELN